MVASFPFTTYFRNQYDGCVVLFHYHETAPIPAIETDVVTLDLEHIGDCYSLSFKKPSTSHPPFPQTPPN